ncbi:TOM complex subunit Tom20 [Schizosaccharomyces japonicus yFS275]|uniref:Mitochondrial import receptor subunit TOM20 n=1 Tax=Schizosaccharomyces japonicus (strain yFS275 / FY16936) TaxID=402676 RepID=B6K411_SCHJY|nr:TOM complex subunit Tom20 [Schizosaccharomyces japonicus yFS275]EEB08218.1 TOM complex subunit Tom20 [Schizosaccharomyces japonicus yFS275]
MKRSVIFGSVVAALAVGYAFYFDYKRRNDPQFRKKLKRRYKKVQEVAESQKLAEQKLFEEKVEKALELVKITPLPSSAEEKELFFMQQVARGEQLFQKQPDGDNIESAVCFYSALKVYPQPNELFSIYERTIPEPIMNLLRAMQTKETTPTVE